MSFSLSKIRKNSQQTHNNVIPFLPFTPIRFKQAMKWHIFLYFAGKCFSMNILLHFFSCDCMCYPISLSGYFEVLRRVDQVMEKFWKAVLYVLFNYKESNFSILELKFEPVLEFVWHVLLKSFYASFPNLFYLFVI